MGEDGVWNMHARDRAGDLMNALAVFGFAALLCATFGAAPVSVRAADAPVSCAVPNSDARVVSAGTVTLPEIARQQNLNGDVTVMVNLDENSKLVSASIAQTPSAILNNAALAAAKTSIFQTRVVACHPVADQYRFIVTFNPSLPFSPEIGAYFLGTWACATGLKSQVVKAYGLARAGTAMDLMNPFVTVDGVIASSTETYMMTGAGLSVTSPTGGVTFTGKSPGWNGDDLVFNGIATAAHTAGGMITLPQTQRRESYHRVDDDHFTHTYELIPPSTTEWVMLSHEACTRIAKPASL